MVNFKKNDAQYLKSGSNETLYGKEISVYSIYLGVYLCKPLYNSRLRTGFLHHMYDEAAVWEVESHNQTFTFWLFFVAVV